MRFAMCTTTSTTLHVPSPPCDVQPGTPTRLVSCVEAMMRALAEVKPVMTALEARLAMKPPRIRPMATWTVQ